VQGLVEVDDSILVVIDVQARFLGKLAPVEAVQLVDRISWLVELARRVEVPIIVTEEEPERQGSTHADVVAALAAGHPRHVKPTFGLAASPAILAAVEASSRSTAVLVGLETDVCVAQSALGLAAAGWRVVAVEDAIGSPGTAHAQGLQRLRDAGITTVGTKSLAYEWIRSVDRLGLLPERPAPAGIVL
jgi:nicotinamidase-related amidase